MNISAIFPAYNEAENIKKTIVDADLALSEYCDNYEIIVVDDGSTDGTHDILIELKKQYRSLNVITNNPNAGYGISLKKGFDAAIHDYVFYTDSDNQFDIREIILLINTIKNADIAVGYRLNRHDNALRKFLSWGFNKAMKIIFGVKIKDVDCAFKLFDRRIFNKIKIESKNFFVDIEIIAKAQNLGYKIKQVGVHHYPRILGESTVNPSDIPRTIRETIRIYRSIKNLKSI